MYRKIAKWVLAYSGEKDCSEELLVYGLEIIGEGRKYKKEKGDISYIDSRLYGYCSFSYNTQNKRNDFFCLYSRVTYSFTFRRICFRKLELLQKIIVMAIGIMQNIRVLAENLPCIRQTDAMSISFCGISGVI